MINIVIPCAGKGQRFIDQGYTIYKAYLPVGHKLTMLEAVTDNITPEEPHSLIVLTRDKVGETQGAAETVLYALNMINNEEELLIVNCDQLVDEDINKFLAMARKYDGCIMTFPADHPRWSYAKVEGGLVTEVAEKKVISDEATVGIYYYKKGKYFVNAAKQMMDKDKRVNGEFYVCPVFNEMIDQGLAVGTHKIDQESMHGLGTPEDYEKYVKSHFI